MRNRQAARYARRSAAAAGVVVLIVAGVYLYRAIEILRLRHTIPAMVAAAIQQASANFSYSDVEQGRTVFTIRASHATQFKDQNRAVLEDVWITVYGREGNRNDNIHTRECSYQPVSGAIRCAGEVRIDLQSSAPAKGATAKGSDNFHVTTSDLSFNRLTGEASTAQPVEFRFAAGQGRGIGIAYSTSDSIVRVEHNIEFDLKASERTGGVPVTATGSNLRIRRNDRVVLLGGPASVSAGARKLTADNISVNLDENFDAREAIAAGHATLRAGEGDRTVDVEASKFETRLAPDGWVSSLSADGQIVGVEKSSAGTQRFSASHVEIAMIPERNLAKEMTATGDVTAASMQNGDSQNLKTQALRVTFSAPPESRANQQEYLKTQQHVEAAETVAPATIESKSGNDSTTLRAQKFLAKMNQNRLEQLLGRGGVEIQRVTGAGMPQMSSASALTATFGAGGDWATIDETGNVRFQQDDRSGAAEHAHMVRSTGEIALEGMAVVADAVSRTTAASMIVNQSSGDLRATGGVTSTYLPAQGAGQGAIRLGTGPAHISSDTLKGSTASGHVVYAGHSRLWQGESVLDADQIEVWRDEKKMQASGHVFAVFPQAAGPFAAPMPVAAAKTSIAPAGTGLWNVRAPLFTYWSDDGRAHLEGGVTAASQQESLESRTLDLFLSSSGTSDEPGSTEGTIERLSPRELGPGSRQLSRVLAQGDVVVRQGDRRGTAEQAEYTASDGKFVLSGGHPTLTNSARDTTAGHSLTFFVANDTILIDSKEGSRTLTRHRVEK